MARVLVNGQLVGRENLRAAGKHLPDLSDVYLPLMTVAAGLLSAIALLGIFRPADRKPARLLAAAGGVLGGTLLLITGGASALPTYKPWMPVLGLAAGAAVAMSITRDSRCGSSRESSS
jgi:peptidoglycan/LPS O-acetylase OafA/YrhL